MDINKSYKQKFIRGLFTYPIKSILLLILIFLFASFKSFAAEPVKEIKIKPIISFDEVPIEILVSGYLRFETDVIITDAKRVYINIEGLFKNLGISCQSSNNGNILSGFIEKESRKYSIDFNSYEIKLNQNSIQSKNGIIKELGNIYIESTIITEAFGLNIIFNYRSLSIKLEADFELPLIKQMRLEKMRKNISKLQNKTTEVDSILKRDYHLFKGGMADWSLASYQTENEKTNNRIGLGLGAELLYGQANISANYNDLYTFNNRQLYYNWRWVDDTKQYIKQAELGKIYSNSISFLSAPLVGASFNNTPNTVRKASGFHTIQEYTEPNWTVELYINDNLVDYTQSDASGLYVFEIPIVYGYTTLKLKFYGPLGEERIEERTMSVPFTFMPAKVLEYKVSGGIIEDGEHSKYGHGELNYGVNSFITIGAGAEYLSSIPDKPLIPFAKLSIQPFSKMILNFEYAHDVRLKGLLNYNFGKSAYLEIDYTNYVDGQLATRFNANEERKIKVTIPFKMNKISGYAKINYNQYLYNSFNYNQFDAVFSIYYKNYSANISTLLNWIGDNSTFASTNLSLSYRMRNGLVFRPSIESNISDHKLIRYGAEIEKRVSKMYFSASFERNELSNSNNAFLSFRYDLPFARLGLNSSRSNKKFSFSENMQGSLAFGADNGMVKTNYNSALAKGGILCYPFLDLNQNGKRDKGEQLVLLSNVKVSGGNAVISKKDSIVRISDLNAFINYNITFSNDDLDNIAWKFKHKTYQVLVDPNQYKKVFVPVLSLGEVSGMVYLQKENNTIGQARITVQIIDEKGNKVAETLTEHDGYFSYLGLKPGKYTIKIDEKQLKKLGYESTPNSQSIKVKTLIDGDIIDGIDFIIKKFENSLTTKIKAVKSTPIKVTKATIKEIKNKITETIVKTTLVKTLNLLKKENNSVKNELENKKLPFKDKTLKPKTNYYSIELGVFKNGSIPKKLLRLNPVFTEQLPNNSTRYTYGIFSNSLDAKNKKNGLLLKGIKGTKVVFYKQQTSSNYTNSPFKKLTEIKEPFYSVQIGVFKNQVTPTQLLNLSPIFYEELPNKTSRYISGKYNLKSEAINAKNKIIKLGIKDAFVVAYLNGTKIKVETLDLLIKNSTSPPIKQVK
ncbi:MSCRAMM family protein [Lutibacter citreus]|uniref:MSCRAMM family protein n=1 Tax=Lutibacter citreus TaxID=2138210 RepID=UPI000DBE6D44|nr:hypothetical protein [Lutibacter citreus]